jgi:acyl-CoA reductase-like NAD-dependent aldehyde dehydrogenase
VAICITLVPGTLRQPGCFGRSDAGKRAILAGPALGSKRIGPMTHRYVQQLQKARERLVAHRREMAEIIINTAAFIPERAVEFTEIQDAIKSIDEAIEDEAKRAGTVLRDEDSV